MVLLQVLSQLFRLDFTPAAGLFFDHLLLFLLCAGLIVFFVPDRLKAKAAVGLVLFILLASLDLSFFVGLFQWNAFCVLGVIVGASAAGKKWFEQSVMLLFLLASFGLVLVMTGWVFAKDLLVFTVVYAVLQLLFSHTAWKKRLDPFLTNGLLLLMSWFFTFHW